MFLQICLEYTSLPSPFDLRNHQIKFFYDAIRKSLHKHTKPRPRPRK